ncbi:PGF-CTERM sorting domain-containing protein, partial [Halorubrum sp. N11]|uniref:PGF-CTERM sorting domain-containing protein n=1 Tax=Halorubrum sp. N11 TaxID=3402276 RepID=UPI003EB78BC2
DLDAGDYTHGVATEDGEATGTLTIEAAEDGGSEDGGADDGGADDGGSDDGGADDGGADDGGSEDGTPGFGALVALVALIAAALLATRRND